MTALLTSPWPRTPARVRRRAVSLTRLAAVVALLDAAALATAAAVAAGLRFETASWPPSGVDRVTGLALVDLGWVVPAWLGALAVTDAWSPRTLARGGDELRALLRGTVLGAGLVAMAAYLADYDMSRGFFALAWVIGTLALLLERYAVRRVTGRLRHRQRLVERIVVVGDPEAVRELHAALARRPGLGYRIVGACVARDEHALPVPVVGDSDPTGVVRACREHDADILLVTHGSTASSVDLRQLSWELQDSGIDLVVVPNLVDVAAPRIRLHPVAGLPFVHVDPPQADRALRWGKAVFDRIGAAVLLVVLAPLLAAIAAAILLDDGGPVLYRHRRVGLGGREFWLWKFRTMAPGAADVHDALVGERASPLLFKLVEDPRVTRVGRFLRRSSLDELPQLVNVVCGRMSLVGPRPQVAAEVACYDDRAHRRLRVRPGMTGLWQVSGRSDLSADEATRLDLSYVENWSMTADLVILARTLGAVLRRDGAY